jgi:ribosomal protein L31E
LTLIVLTFDRSTAWNNIRPQLESIIQKTRSEKAEKQRALMVSAQKRLEVGLQEAYEVNLQKRKVEAICLLRTFVAEHFSGEQHPFAPSHLDIDLFKSITWLSNEHYASIPLTKERFKSVENTLRCELDCFRIAVKQNLTSMLLNYSWAFVTNPNVDLASSYMHGLEYYTEAYCDSILDRASALFRCRRCPRGLLFRFDELLQHHHRFEYQWSVFLRICVATDPFAFGQLILQECGLPEEISAKTIDTYFSNSFGLSCAGDQSFSLVMAEKTHFGSLVCHLMHCGLACHRFTLFNDPILELGAVF